MTYKEACERFAKTKKAFNSDDFNSIVEHQMSMILKTEAQIKEDGGDVMIDTSSCRWSLEQAITNRSKDENMVEAGYRYVETVQNRLLEQSGLL